MRYREVAKTLRKQGCEVIRQNGTSHVIWYRPLTNRNFPVPNHPSRDIPKPFLRELSKQSGVKLI
ncbi:type II toxin-antitoxin system HicA family toxin [Bacillus subtilis]|uniref:type II toxin-antitoxin system HicA family toxin n=1 Tax=Bacillus subtilis TaxID=1423 RepID=UPI003F85A4A2